MIVQSFLAAAILAALPAALSAQGELRPGGIVASAGIGAGTLSLSCNACDGWLDAGRSGFARVGMAIRKDVILSTEVSGWVNDVKRSDASAAVRVVSAHLAAQWYPAPTSGLFAKAGVGVATVRERVAMNAAGEATVKTRSPSVVIGAGWELPVNRSWSMLPYLDLDYVLDSTEKVNGVRTGHELGGALVHAGVAVSFR